MFACLLSILVTIGHSILDSLLMVLVQMALAKATISQQAVETIEFAEYWKSQLQSAWHIRIRMEAIEWEKVGIKCKKRLPISDSDPSHDNGVRMIMRQFGP